MAFALAALTPGLGRLASAAAVPPVVPLAGEVSDVASGGDVRPFRGAAGNRAQAGLAVYDAGLVIR